MPNELIPEVLIRYGAQIGEDTIIMPPLHVHNIGKFVSDHFANLSIGSHCYLGPEVFLDLKDRIEIEDQVTISMRVSLITHIDVGHSPLGSAKYPPENEPIAFRQGSYIGAGAIVLKGVEIGENTVIGAGCVVVKNVAPRSIMVGGANQIIRPQD